MAAYESTANSGLRVRDTDRVDACALLDAARDNGQLTDAEHATRTAAAMRARTFGEVEAVVDDLQIPANLVDSPVVSPARRRSSRRWIVAAAVVAGAALIGMFCGWVSSEGGPIGKPAPADMTTAAGIESFLAAYRAHFGDLLADDVTLHPDNASIERPGQGDPAKSERISYKGEFDTWTTSTREPDLAPIDLGAIDVPKLAALMAGAARTVGAPQAPISHLIIDRTTLGVGKEPVITIYTEGARGGYLVTSLAGEPLYVSKAR
ncbi:DUF1707 SHOCT-like domain-containing protein [Nocardia spumae]|uniref:DUF1707 SHOCT-like domain-containing protein n=1 Tax=Nocardia spumae TaxID=2887190 RepID=UPI001D146E63|nr:DUF1707 domain-containing protein [Nocardia spumae]